MGNHHLGGAQRRAGTAVMASTRILLIGATVLAVAVPAVPRQVAVVDPALDGDAIVRATTGQSEAVAAFARREGATDVRVLDRLDMVSAHLNATATRALAANVYVRTIDADQAIAASDLGTGGDKSAADTNNGEGDDEERAQLPPSDGKGILLGPQYQRFTQTHEGEHSVAVAVVDSGVAENPELNGKVLARVDFVNDGATTLDPGGHGTFVAGLIAGRSTGVDPSAKIVSLRVLNSNGVGRSRDALAAFDWLLRHHRQYGIGVVNLSWGAPQKVSYHQDVLAAAAESLWFAGLTVIAAGGNEGSGPATINTPGSDPFVITVGSLTLSAKKSATDERESSWSSRGPTLDGFAKPDILAPGDGIESLRVPGSFLDRTSSSEPNPQLPATYTTMSGTSVAAAVVSGVAAALLSDSRMTPTRVKSLLVSTASPVRGSATKALRVDAALRWGGRGVALTPVNRGLLPSKLLLEVIAATLGSANLTWEHLTWESITWQTITWENITWETLTWETVTWESLTWEVRRE